MTILACVYKTGGDFTLEYVRRLAESLNPYGRTVCLSDDPQVSQFCEHVPLIYNYPGWWSKLELFRFQNELVLYFDLDTVINGDLKPLLGHPHEFTMLSDFYKPRRPASGVLAFDGDYKYILDEFSMDQAEHYKVPQRWGDQGWLSERVEPERWQDILPSAIVSYKASTKDQRQAASVICYHGKPRPHETGWAI